MKLLLMLAGAGGLYWAYRNGLGAFFGACPAGYQVVQDMFPGCRDSRVMNNITAANVNSQPKTQLPFPWEWAPTSPGGSQWVPVTESAMWPAPAAPTGLSGYRRRRSANYRRAA